LPCCHASAVRSSWATSWEAWQNIDTQPNAKPVDVREACITEAFKIIEESGLESLSLREVARRLGVSHQAPYKHFPSRDHILAEILARTFDEFAAFLEGQPIGETVADLGDMGALYMDYALRHPLKYRLMFNTPMPEPQAHPGMMKNAQRAFAMLRDRLQRMELRTIPSMPERAANLDALFVWSTLHGLASILQSDALATLELSEQEIQQAMARCLGRIGLALMP
jgi:AcrR family transcriptional regulator